MEGTLNLLELWPIIAFIVVQTVGLSWWASSVTTRLSILTESFNLSRNFGERLAKIEISIENIERALAKIELRAKNNL